LERQEEGVGTYISKAVADLLSYTASHPECPEFHAPHRENYTPHKRSLIATGMARPRRVPRYWEKLWVYWGKPTAEG